MDMELKICHMYPRRAEPLRRQRQYLSVCAGGWKWRHRLSGDRTSHGEKARLADCDLVFIGGGQDFEQEVLLDDLHRGKDAEIRSAVADGKTFLTICGGYQMLGNYYETHEGVRCDFIGAVDPVTP